MKKLIEAVEELQKGANLRHELVEKEIANREPGEDITALNTKASIELGKYLAYCEVLDLIWKEMGE